MSMRVGGFSSGLSIGPGPLVLGPGAIADYGFTTGTYSGPPLTCVRASSAYVEDLAGNWTLVPANTLRRSNKGVLVEESRVNGIRNNSMQGAVVGTPGTRPTNWFVAPNANIGTLVASVVGLGTESGIDYIDVRLVGTSTGAGYFNVTFGAAQEAAASSGQTWTASAFVSLLGGTTVNTNNPILGINEYSAVNAFLANSSGPVALTTGALGPRRFVHTRTLNNASTAGIQPFFGVNYAAGAVDITLRIGWPQLEQGAFATSPIRTTGTAATRAADVITAPLSFGPAFTMIGIGRAPALSNVVNRVFARGAQGGVNKYRVFLDTSNNLVAGEGANNVSRASGLARGQRACFAASGDVSGQSLSIDGGALATGPGLVSSHDVLNIGDGAGAPWNDFVERVIVLSYRATNADVQRLSQLSTWGG